MHVQHVPAQQTLQLWKYGAAIDPLADVTGRRSPAAQRQDYEPAAWAPCIFNSRSG